nr:MAG TPA: hypothetical protein [Caudoviricetes sp.]
MKLMLFTLTRTAPVSLSVTSIKFLISFIFLKLSGTKVMIIFEKQANKMIFLKLSTLFYHRLLLI